jgi:hypothetical protein
MYFFIEPLFDWAIVLKAEAPKFGLELNPDDALRFAFYITYRHELFHYHVERFAIRHEVAQRKPIYRPYEREVYNKMAGKEFWLEEALAQAVVLESTLVSKRLGFPNSRYRKFLEAQFDQFGNGYKHFRGPAGIKPERAHKILGAEILTAEIIPPFLVTELATPKREYTSKPESVPGYWVSSLGFMSRFQLAMPKKRKWPRYAKETGFRFYGPGPGDHQVWIHGDQKVHINYVNGEIDKRSLEEVSRMLGKSLREVVEEMRQC